MRYSQRQHLLSKRRGRSRMCRCHHRTFATHRKHGLHNSEKQMIGVLRATYPLSSPGRYISVYLDPTKSFNAFVAFHKHGFNNAVLSADEWKQFLNASEEIEQHLNGIRNYEGATQVLEIGNRYILKFTTQWKRPGILLALRNDIPTLEDMSSFSDVYISAVTWRGLKMNFDLINHVLSTRVGWEHAANDVYTTVYSDNIDAVQNMTVDTCGTNKPLDILKNVIDAYLHRSIEHMDPYDTFDVVTFLHEMIVYYPQLF